MTNVEIKKTIKLEIPKITKDESPKMTKVEIEQVDKRIDPKNDQSKDFQKTNNVVIPKMTKV